MNWKRIRKISIFALVVLAIAFVITSWFVGSRLIASANRPVGAPPSDMKIESTTIPSESGSDLATWYIPTDDATATIVLLHSIRADRRSMLGRARLYSAAGYSIVMVDLQAHGESEGESITVGFLEKHDAIAAINFARTRNPDHKIAVVGCSLGGASTLLANPQGLDALVLESVYTSIDVAIEDRLGMRLGSLKYPLTPTLLCQMKLRLGINASDLRPIDFVAELNCPILIASGDHDQHTPMVSTRRMFDAAASPKELVIFEGAPHTDLLAYDEDLYQKKVLPFLDRYLRSTIDSHKQPQD